MSLSAPSWRWGAATACAAALALSGVPAVIPALSSAAAPTNVQYREHAAYAQGSPSKEVDEANTAAAQRAQARNAPGVVAPGAYGAAFTSLSGLGTSGAAWTEVTNKPYNADDPRYRDPNFSNSSGGAGIVSGRVTGLTADAAGNLYAGGADGGVFRSVNQGKDWTAISDNLPTLSTGDLRIAPDGALWLATGEANTGATSYLGSGVYRLANPGAGAFTIANRVGGPELESTMINKIKFDDQGNAYAATSRGLWRHSSTDTSGAWQDLLHAVSTPPTTYDDIFNDVEVQPGTSGRVIIANAAWRGGATYNGFYLSSDAGATFTKVEPQGAIVGKNVGNAEFSYSKDGSALYAVVEDTALYLTGRQSGNSVLMGVFRSTKGVAGPWTMVADYRKLGSSGSALSSNAWNRGYGPGVQAWYNNFIAVDPQDAGHVFVGLEEVFETRNAGATWKAVGPYWNFGFKCWSISDPANSCPGSTHPDQHAVVITADKVFVGNDGGVYAAPRFMKTNANGNGIEWKSLNGNLRTLQYYSVGTGVVDGGMAVAGGLQDNGGSLLLPGEATMVSPFGGDGGDIIVDPTDGCKILDEYVYLTLWVTTTCGRSNGTVSAVKDVSVPDPNPRFTAPFRADSTNKNHWVAGGQKVWTYDQGFAISDGLAWTPVYDVGAGRSITGLESRGDIVYAGWCGPCNPTGFKRGIATNFGGTWHPLALPTGFPNRYVSNVVMDPKDAGKTAYAVLNGFSRRWTDGPGSGVGHLWKTIDGGVTWTDASAGLPDVPANDLVVTASGGLVLATDLGVLYKAADSASWTRLGTNHPYTTVMDLHVGPDGLVYSATHGRGIWSIALPS